MPVTLQTPLNLDVLDVAKVVSFKVENNVEHWIEIWLGFGTLVDGVFVEGAAPPAYFKIENGVNPLAPNVSLRKCTSCDLWYVLEDECPACGGDTAPYDGFTRLVETTPSGDNLHDAISAALYAFLETEQVPDPDTGEIVPLLVTV